MDNEILGLKRIAKKINDLPTSTYDKLLHMAKMQKITPVQVLEVIIETDYEWWEDEESMDLAYDFENHMLKD